LMTFILINKVWNNQDLEIEGDHLVNIE
jgi:hypothetical protein